jgi:hypothetical protein
MNKKHYAAPEVELIEIQMEAGCLQNASTMGGTITTVEAADYQDEVDW